MNYRDKIKLIYCIGLLTTILSFSCSNKFHAKSNSIPIISLQQLEKITRGDAPLYIINFWATWCKPCVEELPYFEQIHKKYKDKGIETILVSLDFVEDLNKKVQPFVVENQLQSKVYLLDVEKQKGWIDQVNSNWSGAIPATIIQSKFIKNTFFKEGELSLTQLEELVEKYYQQSIKNK